MGRQDTNAFSSVDSIHVRCRPAMDMELQVCVTASSIPAACARAHYVGVANPCWLLFLLLSCCLTLSIIGTQLIDHPDATPTAFACRRQLVCCAIAANRKTVLMVVMITPCQLSVAREGGLAL